MSSAVWLVISLLILINGFYVAAEYGAVGVRRSRVRRLAGEGRGLAARLLPHVESPAGLNRYVAASQIGITVSSLTLGAYAQATMAVAIVPWLTAVFHLDHAAARSTADITVLIALAIVQALLGEFVPKTIALQFPTEIALAAVLPMQWSLRALRPFIAAVNGTTGALLAAVGLSPAGERHLHSPDEIALLIAESRDGGLLEPDEQQRLHRALHLGLKRARDLMVPLDRLAVLSVDTPWDAIVRFVTNCPYSRVPVFRGAPDEIIGTLRVKDLAQRLVTSGPAPLSSLLRPIAHVAEDLPADELIAVLRERRTHQAVVRNAAGRAAGLVTIQDVLVELLGTHARP